MPRGQYRFVTLMIAISFGLLLPGGAASQACLAVGTMDGQGFFGGSASFTEGAWAPGISLGYDAPGPMTVGAQGTYSLADNSDVAVATVGGFLAAEIPNLSFSVCPVAGVSYTWLADAGELAGVDADGVVLGGGLAVGGRIESDANFAVIPAAQAQLVHARASASFGGVSGTGSETFGNFSGAFTLDFGSVFFGPSASISTQDGADPVFTARIGVAF